MTSGGGSSSSGEFQAPDIPMAKSVGAGEGQVNILAWPGYAEDGSHRQGASDWVTPLREEDRLPGQRQGRHVGRLVGLMKTGDYDVVSASGDATLR